MTRDTLLEQLERSPQLPLYVREAQHLLEEEGKKRERFYATVREDQKVEFINGETVMHSPAKKRHSDASQNIFKLLDAHVQLCGLGWVAHEKTLISLTRNDYEPDVLFFSTAKAGAFTVEQWQFPAPDLVVEVLSASTARNDRGVKWEDYAAHGIQEYWIVDPEAESLEQNVLGDGRYALVLKSGSGEVKSTAVPGFLIPIRAVFDPGENLKALQAMLSRR